MEIPRLDYTLAVQEASELRDLLSKHGFVVLTALPPTTLTTLGDAMVAGQRFFSLPQTMKDKLVVNFAIGMDTSPREYGYVDARQTKLDKEQLFLVKRAIEELEPCDMMQGPHDEIPEDKQSCVSLHHMVAASGVLHDLCHAVLHVAAPEVWAMLQEIPATSAGTSALDCFLYHNQAEDEPDSGIVSGSESSIEGCPEHEDPGLLTVAPCSVVPGLELLDQHSGEWVRMEDHCTAGEDIIVFCGTLLSRLCDPMDAMLHRVTCRRGCERLSLLYEMRLREGDVMGWKIAKQIRELEQGT